MLAIKTDKWKPSIIRTVAGNSVYQFQGQVFESGKLRVEFKILNPNIQTQILPLKLTIEYQENIRDDFFSFIPDFKKSIVEILENIKPCPFKLSVFNPNRSPISITASLPKLTKRMDYFAPQQPTDPALLTALNGLTAGMGAQAGQIADAIANNQMITENFPNTLVGTTIQQLLAVDQTRQSAVFTNWSLFKVKLWNSTAPIASLSYNSDGAFITLDAAKQIGNELIQGGVVTLGADECKGNIYAVGQQIAGSRGIAITTTKTAP